MQGSGDERVRASSPLHCHHLAGQVLVPDVTALLALKIVSNGGLGLPLG